ncbi:MAG: VRR-NUC domain-containing protein [Candidatus Nanoarchaeia archaeon]
MSRSWVLPDYFHAKVLHVYVPMHRKYKKRQGLSERQIRKRLEKQGWVVWRGGSLGLLRRDDVYPSVYRKYEKLQNLIEVYYPDMFEYLQYLCAVHHGMPDFLCYRNGEFKFIECKLENEPLSYRQKLCIICLQQLGFVVEVHKFVNHRTKLRLATIDLINGDKFIHERQLTIRQAIA